MRRSARSTATDPRHILAQSTLFRFSILRMFRLLRVFRAFRYQNQMLL